MKIIKRPAFAGETAAVFVQHANGDTVPLPLDPAAVPDEVIEAATRAFLSAKYTTIDGPMRAAIAALAQALGEED